MVVWFSKLWRKTPTPTRSPSEIEFDERAVQLVNLGDKMFQTDDVAGAREAYESALRLDSKCAPAWRGRAQVFLRDDQILKALACLARSVELNPQTADVWRYLGEGILLFLKHDLDPSFIRENRLDLVSEASDCFQRSLKLKSDLIAAQEGLATCRSMMQTESGHVANPRHFSFHSGGPLEKAKREAVTPFLRPSDYRRQPLPPLDE